MHRKFLKVARRTFTTAEADKRQDFTDYFSKLKEDQQRVNQNSVFEFKRQWNKYSEMANSGDILSSNHGIKNLNMAQLGRANVFIKAYSNFTKDEAAYFNQAIKNAIANLKVSETEEVNVDKNLKDFTSTIIR
jgi:hypothetical protein